MSNRDNELRMYFTGALDEAATDAIDLRMIEEPSFEEALAAAEIELVEDYLDGVLAEDERRLFEANYFVTDERVRDVETVAALRAYARRDLPRPERAELNGGLFERLRQSFRGLPTYAYASAAILLIATSAVWFWLGWPDRGPQAEFAAVNRQNLSDLTQFGDARVVELLPGDQRSSARLARLDRSAAETFLIKLALGPEVRDKAAFNLVIKREKTEMFRAATLSSYESGKELRFLLPTRLLMAGEYRIEASPADNPAAGVAYRLTVE